MELLRALLGPSRILGNHVVIARGDGTFVALAHLRRHSIRVREGHQVAVGDRIAACGNFGNSSEPHLHLQVMDHARPVLAVGVPFRFVTPEGDALSTPTRVTGRHGRPDDPVTIRASPIRQPTVSLCTRISARQRESWWEPSHQREEMAVTASMRDRTWTEDAAGGHLETHLGDFAVDVVRGDGSERVVIRGQLNGATAPLLLGVLDSVYVRRPRRLEVDLSGLTGLAAHTLIALVAAHRRQGCGAELVLLDPNPLARRVLVLTGLNQMVEESATTARRSSG